jgi:hypothetical protein
LAAWPTFASRMISLSTTAFYNGSYKWPQRDAVG